MNSITTVDFYVLDWADHTALQWLDLGPATRAKYERQLQQLAASGTDPLNFAQLAAYAGTLSPGSRRMLRPALCALLKAKITELKSFADPGNVSAIQSLEMRLEAMSTAIQVEQPKGETSHTWLTLTQIKKLMSVPDKTTFAGRRDWILLAVLLGSGIRREELVNLQFYALAIQGDRWVLDILGKGEKNRVVPISDTLATALHAWKDEIGDGYVVRSLKGNPLPVSDVFRIVEQYGKVIGVDLAPHDLRRTYARIGYEAGIPIEQISKLLGHASIETTKRYIGVQVDLRQTVSDFIPL